ncbi:MAG TPA: glycosyltransferase family 4 protein [Acidimicrobiales bacterium]|nr:glycosyltransferase family 4 protein [Acidimicrobiales bacterium]
MSDVVFLKPDFGVQGGFELLMDRCRAALVERGIEVSVETFRAHEAPDHLAGLPLPRSLWFRHPEYFSYLANVERVDALRIDPGTVVVTTQPPTYLLDHPRVVALTYHQARVFYELSEAYIASGYSPSALHREATAQVRLIDRLRLPATHTWLAGSAEVARRLAATWDVAADVFQANAQEPPDREVAEQYDPAGPALCVSRHAWPKRTELAALAGICDTAGRTELVGGGGRQPYVEALAARFGGDPAGAAAATDELIWLNRGDPAAVGGGGTVPDRVRVRGHLDRADVVDAFRRASVVVAPAHREDYGLTVLEAFAFGRPVIVCRDGGGLVELVEGTDAGLVVEPRPQAIADAVASLRDDPERARAMAERAFTVATELEARDDIAVLVDAVERAGAGVPAGGTVAR